MKWFRGRDHGESRRSRITQLPVEVVDAGTGGPQRHWRGYYGSFRSPYVPHDVSHCFGIMLGHLDALEGLN